MLQICPVKMTCSGWMAALRIHENICEYMSPRHIFNTWNFCTDFTLAVCKGLYSQNSKADQKWYRNYLKVIWYCWEEADVFFFFCSLSGPNMKNSVLRFAWWYLQHMSKGSPHVMYVTLLYEISTCITHRNTHPLCLLSLAVIHESTELQLPH